MRSKRTIRIHPKVVEQVMCSADERFSPSEVDELHRAFPDWENRDEFFLDSSLSLAVDIVGNEVEYRLEQLRDIRNTDPHCDDYVDEDIYLFTCCRIDMEAAGLL